MLIQVDKIVGLMCLVSSTSVATMKVGGSNVCLGHGHLPAGGKVEVMYFYTSHPSVWALRSFQIRIITFSGHDLHSALGTQLCILRAAL